MDVNLMNLSEGFFSRSAEVKPRVTPIISAIKREITINSIVAGKTSLNSSITGRPVWRDFPKFP
jgi:hypothetical protein